MESKITSSLAKHTPARTRLLLTILMQLRGQGTELVMETGRCQRHQAELPEAEASLVLNTRHANTKRTASSAARLAQG